MIRATARCAFAIGCSFAACISPLQAITLDLTTGDTPGGVINDAIYFADNIGSGSGVFGKTDGGVFLRIQEAGGEEGYNTSVNDIMDNKNSFTKDLFYSSLNQVTIGGEQHLAFLLDVNEGGNDGAQYITLENLQIFSSSDAGLSFQTIGELASDDATTLIYNMDTGGDFSVLLAGTGSGHSEMGLFIPLFSFSGNDEHIILYSEFSGSDSGFEEWSTGEGALPADDPGKPPVVLPEPSSGILGLLGMCLLFLRRSK